MELSDGAWTVIAAIASGLFATLTTWWATRRQAIKDISDRAHASLLAALAEKDKEIQYLRADRDQKEAECEEVRETARERLVLLLTYEDAIAILQRQLIKCGIEPAYKLNGGKQDKEEDDDGNVSAHPENWRD